MQSDPSVVQQLLQCADPTQLVSFGYPVSGPKAISYTNLS
jgi:hypothetical protein